MSLEKFMHNKYLGISVVALVAAGSVAAQALAQTATETETETGKVTVLNAITITGSRGGQQISETARTVYVVEAQQIQMRARSGETIQQILAQEIPSFDPVSQGSRTSYGQNLRGRTALVLIDGISMNSARGLSRQFDSIDPFNIERIEVLSGATSLYGGNATGGIINIITKKGKDAPDGLHGEITAGNDLDRNGAAAVTYNSETWDARLSLAGNRSGAFYDADGTMVVPDITQTSTAFNRRIDLMGSAGFQFDPDRRLEVSGQYFNSEQKSDYSVYFGQFLAGLRNPSLIETRDGYNSDFNPRTRRSMLNATYTDNDFFGSEPLDGLRVTYGVDADRDSLSSNQHIFNMSKALQSGAMDFQTAGITGLYPKIDVTTFAGFVEASYEATDRLTFNGGVRYQYTKTEVGDFVGAAQQIAILNGTATSADSIPGGSVDYDAFLFNAGATYSLTNTQQVYANFSQGFELPDPAKYYGYGAYSLSGGHYTLLSGVNVANSALEAIKTNSFEIGYRLDDGTYNLEAAGFYSTSDRSIVLNRTTLAVELEDNERRVYGIEGKAGMKLNHGFDVGILGQWVRTEVDQDGDWVKDTIGSASVSKLGGHIGWSNETLNLRLQGQHVFDLEDNSDYKIEGYTLFDLIGSYHVEKADMTVNFGVHNLFNKEYNTVWGSRAKALYGALAPEEIFDYKGRGRTFALALSKNF
jgi:iron complex outermembrane receptor protein